MYKVIALIAFFSIAQVPAVLVFDNEVRNMTDQMHPQRSCGDAKRTLLPVNRRTT